MRSATRSSMTGITLGSIIGSSLGKRIGNKGFISSRVPGTFPIARIMLPMPKGMASIIIGHVMVKQFNDPMCEPYDQYQWNIHHKAAAIFMQWADSILFCKREDFVRVKDDDKNKATSAGRRMIYTQDRPAHPGGGRGIYGRLSYAIELDYAAWINELNEAEEVEKAE